jgi:hypothetical protein
VPADPRNLRRVLLVALLWIGLSLCAFAVARYWGESRSLLRGGLGEIVVLSGLLALIWALAIASWQQMMRVFSDEPISVRDAARHLALLLLGKYLPGGIWGFVARLTDSAAQRPLARMFAAGIAEQWIGLISISVLALLGMIAARSQHFAWLLAAAAVPSIALATLAMGQACLHRFGKMLPIRWRNLSRPLDAWVRNSALWRAAILTAIQQIAILCVVAEVAGTAFGLTGMSIVAVASAYGIAVAAGVVVVFMPGGILVREGVFVALSSRWLQPAQAIALAAGLRLVFTAFDLLAGMLGGGLQLRRVSRE